MALIKELEKRIRKCLKCGHEWLPRKKQEPIICPNCKSYYWNRIK